MVNCLLFTATIRLRLIIIRIIIYLRFIELFRKTPINTSVYNIILSENK